MCKQECLICDHFPATINCTAIADLCLFRSTLQGRVHRVSTFIFLCNTLTYTFVMPSFFLFEITFCLPFKVESHTVLLK